jgi:hypothetical protein
MTWRVPKFDQASQLGRVARTTRGDGRVEVTSSRPTEAPVRNRVDALQASGDMKPGAGPKVDAVLALRDRTGTPPAIRRATAPQPRRSLATLTRKPSPLCRPDRM